MQVSPTFLLTLSITSTEKSASQIDPVHMHDGILIYDAIQDYVGGNTDTEARAQNTVSMRTTKNPVQS